MRFSVDGRAGACYCEAAGDTLATIRRKDPRWKKLLQRGDRVFGLAW